MLSNKGIANLILLFMLSFHVVSTVTAARDLAISSISKVKADGAVKGEDGKYIPPPPPECKVYCFIRGEPVCCIHGP